MQMKEGKRHATKGLENQVVLREMPGRRKRDIDAARSSQATAAYTNLRMPDSKKRIDSGQKTAAAQNEPDKLAQGVCRPVFSLSNAAV